MITDIEKQMDRLQKEKEDALRFSQFQEAERAHYKVEACREALDYLEGGQEVILDALLDAARQVESDRPRHIARVKVLAEVLRSLQSNTKLSVL